MAENTEQVMAQQQTYDENQIQVMEGLELLVFFIFLLKITCQIYFFTIEYYSRAMRGVSDALLSAIRLAEQNAV